MNHVGYNLGIVSCSQEGQFVEEVHMESTRYSQHSRWSVQVYKAQCGYSYIFPLSFISASDFQEKQFIAAW